MPFCLCLGGDNKLVVLLIPFLGQARKGMPSADLGKAAVYAGINLHQKTLRSLKALVQCAFCELNGNGSAVGTIAHLA